MRFLESVSRRRVSRRENAANQGFEPSSLFFAPLRILLANSHGLSLGRTLGRMGGLGDENLASLGGLDEFAHSIRCSSRPESGPPEAGASHRAPLIQTGSSRHVP